MSDLNRCLKCNKIITFNDDVFIPASCDCGHKQIKPFTKDGIEFQKLLASNPLFLLFYGYYETKNLFVEITLLRKDIPDYDWCMGVAKEQAGLLINLNHHNICPIFEYKNINGYFCVITPAMDGYALSAYNPERDGLLETDKVIDLLQATALGLGVAHYKNIAHHNISPANVHIDERGIIRITNFFLSRFIYIFDQKRIKQNNYIYTSVSPLYISPEKVESGAEDIRGDVFSFGVLFYFLLTAKYPFQGKHTLETIYSRSKLKYKHRRGTVSAKYSIDHNDFPDYIPPPSPKHIRKSIPAETSELIMRMLAYYPNDRPTFAEVIHEFNMLRAKTDALRIRKEQEAIIDSDTKTIPKMKSPFRGRA